MGYFSVLVEIGLIVYYSNTGLCTLTTGAANPWGKYFDQLTSNFLGVEICNSSRLLVYRHGGAKFIRPVRWTQDFSKSIG